MIKKLRNQHYAPNWEQAHKWEQRGRQKICEVATGTFETARKYVRTLGKKKVKFFLGLINESPSHGDVCWSESIAPPFFTSALN
jgi:hypothetical protein